MAFILKITIKGSHPKIFRTVLVPEKFTFLDLHWVIQGLFNWSNEHLYQFHLGKMYDSEAVSAPGQDLDKIRGRYKNHNAKATRLADFLTNNIKKLYYIYDFGDHWVHEISVMRKPKEEVMFPVCIDGENVAPVEDSGGIYGFYDMLFALENTESPDEKAELEDWFGLLPGQKFEDAHPFDIQEINEGLLAIFRK